jgi:hypothetical protein
MTPSNEKELLEQCKTLFCAISDRNAINAYPAMSPYMTNIACNVDNIIRMVVALSRDEILYGKTLGAKVYEMVTGRQLRIPEGIISHQLDGSPTLTMIPLNDICDYMVANRPSAVNSIQLGLPNAGLTFDSHSKRARISFVDSDITIDIENIMSSKCLLQCKMFEEPYEMFIDKTWVEENVFNRIYHAMVGDEHLEPFDEKYMIMNHFFGTVENKKEVLEDHPVHELIKLLSGHDYGDNYDSYADVIMDNGYRLRLDTVQDWGHHSGIRVLKLCSVSKVHEDGKFTSAYNWHRNPLLVRDIIKSLDSVVTDLLENHHKLKLNRDVE